MELAPLLGETQHSPAPHPKAAPAVFQHLAEIRGKACDKAVDKRVENNTGMTLS
ncbi:hypothetical protein [Pseudomonas nicosulfuronedens]